MPEPYELKDIKIPEGSEFHQLIERWPDISKTRFTDGEYLIREGEECMDVFLVLCGSFVVEHAGSDPQLRPRNALAVVTCTPGAPQFVGEMAYLGQGRRTASVRAAMAVYTLCLKPDHLDVIIGEFPLLTRVLCQEFTRRLKETTAALSDLQERLRMEAEQFIAQPGQIIFERGRKADKLFQLVDGAVLRIESGQSRSLRADDLPMGFLDPGPFFGDGAYAATVKAESVAILVAISRKSKLAAARHFPELLVDAYVAAVRPNPPAR